MMSFEETHAHQHHDEHEEHVHDSECACESEHVNQSDASENRSSDDDATHSYDEADNQHAGCNERIQQLEEQLAYLSSDFTNFRRNTEKEKARWMKEAHSSILQDLLSIVDDIDRAVADIESQDVPEEVSKRLEGIYLIHKSMIKLLEKYDVHEITQVETFDPQWHEAVMQVSETDVPSGNIVSVVQKGYTHKGELLRTAKVTVAA